MQIQYTIKVQVIRSKGRANRLYVGLPLALASAIDIEPGEKVQWKLINRSELHLVRSAPPHTKAKQYRKKS